MNDHAADCQGYCCSDFRNHVEPLEVYRFQPRLTNDIHELFEEDMFPGLTTPEYLQLELPLRLASRMLTDQRVVEYIVTCTDGSLHDDHPRGFAPEPERSLTDVVAVEKNNAGSNPPLLRYPRTLATQSSSTPRVSDDMRARSAEILANLKRTLRQISVRDIDDAGFTKAARNHLSDRSKTDFPNSCLRQIIVTLSYRRVFRFQEYEEGSAQFLACHYITARILVHEIAHVLNRAANGWRKEEVFYKDECCNESGLALEQALFGGIAQFRSMELFTEHDREEEAVVSEQWPGRQMFDTYNSPGTNILPLQQRWPLEEWSIMTRIPLLFITSMFTDLFWDRDVPLRGDGPIEPSPKLQWLTKLAQPGDEYVDSVGNTVTAVDEDTVVTCSIKEYLPEPALNAYNAILDEQNARRS